MKYLLYITVLFTLTSCSEKNLIVSNDSMDLSYEKHLLLYKGQAFSGVLIENYEDNSLHEEHEYVNGKLDGLQRIWYPNGNLYSERTYKKGLKVGVHKGWWENGNKKFVYHFNEKGEHHGDAFEWFSNGNPYRLFHYQKGKEEGSQKMFKENGNLRANYVVKNGERFGLIGLKKCDAVSTM